MYVLVGYDAVEDWKSKPTTNLTMAMGEVEVFLNKFLDYFMAQQWQLYIKRYLTELTLAPNLSMQSLAPRELETSQKLSSSGVMTVVSMLQTMDMQRRPGGVGGSH